MNGFAGRFLPALLFGSVALACAVAVGWSVFAANEVPDGPVPIVWDKAACATCSMHVGEPGFAAQIVTRDGHCQAFDDPGCLFLYVAEHGPAVAHMWFHHLREERWVAPADVAFAEVNPTPMGFGLGAVDRGTPGAIDLEAARARCLQRSHGGGGR